MWGKPSAHLQINKPVCKYVCLDTNPELGTDRQKFPVQWGTFGIFFKMSRYYWPTAS
jgi:hypothetical protein